MIGFGFECGIRNGCVFVSGVGEFAIGGIGASRDGAGILDGEGAGGGFIYAVFRTTVIVER